MTIEGINFLNKLHLKKSEKNQKKQGVQIPEDYSSKKNPKASMSNFDKSLAAYTLAAMMMLGGTTSCVQQDVDVKVDNSELLKEIQNMSKAQQQAIELLNQLLALMKENNSQNKEYMQQLIKQNTEILSVLNSLSGSVENLEEKVTQALYRIETILTKSYAKQDEILNKIDDIMNQNISDSEKLDKLIELSKTQTEYLSKIMTLVETLKDGNKDLSETVNNFFDAYIKGQDSQKEMMNNILNAILSNNDISAETLAEIKKITAGGEIDSAKLDAIIKLLESIDSKIGKLQETVDKLYAEFPDLAGKIDEMIREYQKGELTEHALLAEILEEVKKSNASDSNLEAKLDAILNAMNSGQLSIKEAMDQMIDLLGQIKDNTGALVEIVSKISAQIDKLTDKLDGYHGDNIDILQKINNGVGSIDSKLDKIEANQQKANSTMTNILDKMDDIFAEVHQINDKTLTLDQLQQMFGPMFNELKEYLGNISGNQITIDQVENAMAKYKTDLTKTNGLIETLTTVVKNLNLSAGMSEELQKIVDAINDFKNQSAGNHADNMKAYAEILEKLANIDGGMQALGTTANEINDNLKQHMDNAQIYGSNMFEQMKLIVSGISDNTDAMDAFKDTYKSESALAQQSRMEQIALLQALVDKETGGNGGITKQELEEVLAGLNVNIPDYSEVLNNIYDAIGKVITSDDLQNFFIKTQPDLDKTNGLIETLTTVIKNKDFGSVGGGSIETAQMENLLAQILDAVNSKKSPTEDQIKALIELANKIADNTAPNPAPSTRSAIADAYNYLNKKAAEEAMSHGKKATYTVNPDMFSFNA